jgi:glycosyltransferase involved in cell wall biosynthesis
MPIDVAAVIPLYNGADFIEEAIRSVAMQTVPVDETIVVDDGSTDNGPEIVEGLSKSHQMTLLRKPNGGQSSARNFAITRTKCSHIALLDQDDIWYEDHIEQLRRPFLEDRAHNLATVYGNLDHIDKNGRMITHCYLDNISTKHPKTSLQQCLEHDLFILPSASLISNQAIKSVGLFDERLSGYEDDDLFIRMFSAGFRSIYINSAVTKWRLYSSSTSYGPIMRKSRMIYFKKLLESYPDDPVIGLSWGHDVIAPRFMRIAYDQFKEATRSRDLSILESSWAEIQEIAPAMKPGIRRHMRRVAPVIPFLYRNNFGRTARRLARYAIGY